MSSRAADVSALGEDRRAGTGLPFGDEATSLLGAPPRLVIAGTASGVGKTSITAGIAAALVRQGLAIAPFKVGPDYIDPTYHYLATGRACRNLDSWILPHDNLRALFQRATHGVDLALIEGVMGLFDGRNAEGEAGSTAEVARLLRAPVLLVLDVGKQARSAAAVARGFQTFAEATWLAGFLLNRVGSDRHASLVRREVEAVTGLPVLGALPKQQSVTLPERHLGLVPSAEHAPAEEVISQLAGLIAQHADLAGIRAIARQASALPSSTARLFPPTAPARVANLAIASDEAFSFYYQDNLDLLAAHGARLQRFSPLRDSALPPGTDGLYLGGGFPELFAAQLALNHPLLADLRQSAAAGLPIYAECGGLMYLARALTDSDGLRHCLSGLLPCEVSMSNRRTALGYVRLRARQDSLLCSEGTELRGHEFHWSQLTRGGELANAYDVLEPEPRIEGFQADGILGSYVHLHFGANPDLARRFVSSLY